MRTKIIEKIKTKHVLPISVLVCVSAIIYLNSLFNGFVYDDLGTIVDSEGVAIRTGHHCAMPVMDRFGVAATARASFAFYNTEDDIDRLIAGLNKAVEIFRG